MKKKFLLYKEQITYLFCGVSTTIVNFIFFTLFCELNMEIVYANILAFIIAVVFAYFTNKFLVFKSFNTQFKLLCKEFTSFVSLRLISMLIETSILYVFAQVLLYNKYMIKILASIIVIILNYIFGKFITFKKG